MILIYLNIDFINFSNLFNLLNTQIIVENTSFWKILFYFNHNNNNIFLFLITFCFFLGKNTYRPLLVLLFIILTNYSNTPIDFSSIYQQPVNNSSLINGLLIIHPIYIYLTYILIYIYIFHNTYFNTAVNLKNFKKKINKKIVLISYYSLFAIFLGSYWAQQELNWGGWWNWDYVELIALIFFILVIFLIHNKGVYNYMDIFFLKFKYILYILIFYIIVRCDILNSVHSFNSFKVLDKYIQYVYILFVLIFINMWSKYKNYKYSTTHIKLVNFKKNNTFILFNQIFLFLVVYNLIIFYVILGQINNIDVFFKFIINYIVVVYLIFNLSFKLNIVLISIVSLLLNNFSVISFIFYFLIVFRKFFKSKNYNWLMESKIILIHIIMFVVITSIYENSSIFINNPVIDVTDYNFIYVSNLNVVCYEVVSDFLQFFKFNWINNLNLANTNLIWNNDLYNQLNSNIINLNNDIVYKLNNSLINLKVVNLINIFLSTTLLISFIFIFYKRIILKSDIV